MVCIMTVCTKCGYRNTPDKIEMCNYCGKNFDVGEEGLVVTNDKVVNILKKYGHKVVKVIGDEGDGYYYIELDRTTYNGYMEDFTVEMSEIESQSGYRLHGIDVNSGKDIKIWLKK